MYYNKKKNQKRLSQYQLTSCSPEGVRSFVELLQYTVVAPRLLREAGWDTFAVRLSDEEIEGAVRSAGIKDGAFSDAQCLQLCLSIETALLLRQMEMNGFVEKHADEHGVERFQLTMRGKAYGWTRHC